MKPWLIRRKRLVKQLQEAQEENESLNGAYDIVCEQVRREEENHKYTKEQLHRTARERDECYRQKRLSDIRHINTIREMQSAIDEMLETIENEEE